MVCHECDNVCSEASHSMGREKSVPSRLLWLSSSHCKTDAKIGYPGTDRIRSKPPPCARVGTGRPRGEGDNDRKEEVEREKIMQKKDEKRN